jgi:hypothetical protein
MPTIQKLLRNIIQPRILLKKFGEGFHFLFLLLLYLMAKVCENKPCISESQDYLCMNYGPHSRPNSQRDCLNSIKRLDDHLKINQIGMKT